MQVQSMHSREKYTQATHYIFIFKVQTVTTAQVYFPVTHSMTQRQLGAPDENLEQKTIIIIILFLLDQNKFWNGGKGSNLQTVQNGDQL